MLKYAIPLSGWFLLGSYLFYEHLVYGTSGLIYHFLSPGYAVQSIFHVSMLSLPFITTYVGYLVHQKDKLLEKLETEKAKERSILDAVGDAISIQDRDFRILYQNRLHKELQGSHAGEFCYKAYRNKDQVCEGCHTASAMEDGKIRKAERTKTTGNSTRYYEITAAPLADFSGKIIAGIEAVRDITERKLAEEAVRESETRYRTLFESMDAAVVLMQGAQCVDCNPATLRLFGIAGKDEIIGKTPLDFATPLQPNGIDSAEMIRWNTEMALARGTHHFEWQALKATGEKILMEVRLTPLRVDNQDFLQCVALDITDRKRAEEAVRESESRFRAIIEGASEGILTADIESREILYANPAICTLLGYSAQELLSLTVDHLHPDQELSRTIELFQGYVKGNMRSEKIVFKRKDSSTVLVSCNGVAAEIDGKQCLIGFFTDITEKVLLEEERLKSQKLEAIGTLAGGIAHDFNNLLQGIFGYISMAKMTFDQKEKAFAMLEQAEQALHMSVNLTSQLLTFSKGGKPVRKKLILRPLIENAVKFALSGSRVNYDLDIDGKLRTVDADEGQLGQVIQNIVLNADQSMPMGGTVMVTARNVHSSGQTGPLRLARGTYVEICIRDSGIGIPEEYLPRIFDPYFTTKERGSGLGLATCYSIIKNHDGIIKVESEVGKGSTFSIYLPVVEEEAEKTRALPLPATDVRKGRILVMDDEEMVRSIAGEMIRALGHEVEFARNGAEAIAKYREALSSGKRFDIVILDLTIRGGMGGEETFLRLISLDPELKAVVSSGYADSSLLSEYQTSGFRACLTKPYRMEALRNTLNALLR